MSLNWSIEGIKNFMEVCYERMTAEEAEEQGTTIEKLLNQRSFGGGDWYVPGGSDIEELSNAGVIQRLNPVTNMFIWATMSVDLPGITEKNHVEFWVRMRFHAKFHGGFLRGWNEETEKWEPRDVTYEEVTSHIGLHTNVSEKSWREWVNRVVDHARDGMLSSAKLPNSRGTWQNRKLSTVAKDTAEQMEVWREALHRHYCSEDKEENKWHDRDYSWACKADNRLQRSYGVWESIEDRLEEEE